MRKLDALFVHPNAAPAIYQKLSDNLSAIEPPLWAGLLAQYTRRKGFSVDIVDAEVEHYDVAQTVAAIHDRHPRLVVVIVYGQQPSASTQNMHGASELVNALKGAYPSTKVLLVGGHVSALPKKTLDEEQADFVCQGEGVHTIRGLLQADMDDVASLKKIPGLWYREDGKAVFTVAAEIVPEKDMPTEMPGMAWDLLPMDRYRAHNWHCFDNVHARTPYASIYTSLGCPFRCTFCCINAPFGGSSFRYWDPQFIITEFDTLARKYNIHNLKIADEMFVLKEKHFLELCKLLAERDYGFNIWAYSRVDTVKPKHLEALKKAGVNWLALGIESGSKHVRDGVTKGRFGELDIVNIVRQIKEAGINVIGNYIFGLPDDTHESMQSTLDISLDLNCEMANFYSAMAYPGSKLYDIAIEKGWKLPSTWVGYSQHSVDTLPLPTEHLPASEVLAFRDKAWQTYFTSPTYLGYVRKKFGEDTWKHVKEIAKIKLTRKNAATLQPVLAN